ncbi:urea transporter [Streptomyces sp. NPDC127074]|uniref:urea transporter n=1 Tax=Streptomyces sp. NPDC127074 TaxID=3347130 RepID=UPI00365D80A5
MAQVAFSASPWTGLLFAVGPFAGSWRIGVYGLLGAAASAVAAAVPGADRDGLAKGLVGYCGCLTGIAVGHLPRARFGQRETIEQVIRDRARVLEVAQPGDQNEVLPAAEDLVGGREAKVSSCGHGSRRLPGCSGRFVPPVRGSVRPPGVSPPPCGRLP